ncbi:type IV toxin-antitoxin system AbiEi family antitoxin domain-containing protein [Microlunatus parietis]|uniref:AbiEi antitoxin N-terminal domain-containing protein n=1 Tax=Microlunatus parietis TaxID=682979 RepID=A0A7Y9IB95_9ACTN|nr:type IV toxin-antitoxin system AbiEi family antitoxin domain-containing protein [Microlunatus parietis]NYE73525.1 hypothetical protein [Microlunatus parietis]
MSRRTALAQLGDLAAEQWGMVTTAQARRAGVSSLDLARLASDGILAPVSGAARVYRVTSTPESPDLDPLRAAWLQLGGGRSWEERSLDMDAVVSHRSAAHLRGFGDLIPEVHEFYVVRRRQLRRTDLLLRVRPAISRSDWEFVDGMPASRPEQMVADLLADHEDESAVAQIVHDAHRAGLLTPSQLTEVVAPHARRYGHRTGADLATMLLAGAEGVES